MDIYRLLNDMIGISVKISIDFNVTLPIILVVLGTSFFHKKISEIHTKDKTAPLNDGTHLQIHTKDRAKCPELETKDKLITNRQS